MLVDPLKAVADNAYRLALDSWTEQLPPPLVVNGHTMKNALPHIIMLQLAKEWCTILIYRPYYRPVAQMAGTNRPTGASSESLQNLAVRVRVLISTRLTCFRADIFSVAIDLRLESTPCSGHITNASGYATHRRPCSTSPSRPARLICSLPYDTTVPKSEMER
jgi:hypothetical protein